MKILALSDLESKALYDYYRPGKLDGYDLIIACGDLRVSYLEFIVTMAHCPVVYVHGNHDEHFQREPEGCICIDDDVFTWQGVRLLGLGGSFRYGEGKYMYTEREMRRRIRRLWWKLWRAGGVDILVTHAPARGLNDLDDLPHRGFQCFHTLLERYRPRYFVHGHIHRSYGVNIPRRTQHGETTVINAYESYAFDY